MEINRAYEDLSREIMHPHFPNSSFKKPVKDNICWVPTPNILSVVEPPIPSARSSCQYCLLRSKIQELDKRSNKIAHSKWTAYLYCQNESCFNAGVCPSCKYAGATPPLFAEVARNQLICQ